MSKLLLEDGAGTQLEDASGDLLLEFTDPTSPGIIDLYTGTKRASFLLVGESSQIIDAPGAVSLVVQAQGTFGGATVTVKGGPNGVDFRDFGTPISFTSSGIIGLLRRDLSDRYYLIESTGSTSASVTMTIIFTRGGRSGAS